jgi:glycosyltransferase involved in cell wall biosynthesis
MPLLTIAIPTYNRAADLQACLARLAGQPGVGSDVELLVSDNCSTDNTPAVVKAWQNKGVSITYLRNVQNIGPDNNFVQCYAAAKGKYFWLLGDDDMVLDGAVERVTSLLRSGEFGAVYLNSYGFRKDLEGERPAGGAGGSTVYAEPAGFLRRAGYYLTFISGNVVNKSLLGQNLDFEPFRSTNLIQLCWTFGGVFAGKPNAVVEDFCLAAKADASGGYQLCKVFGKNFLDACDIFIRRGVNPANFEIIKRQLLLRFFPANIVRARKNILATKPEDYFGALYPLYRGYPYFWLFTVPAIVMPLAPAFALFRAATWLRNKIR